MDNKLKIAAIAAMIGVTGAGLFLTQETQSKYTTGGNGSDHARIAKWHIDKTKINLNLFSTEYTDPDGENVTVKSHTSDKLIAPGTTGFKTIDFKDLDTDSLTEVAYQVKLDDIQINSGVTKPFDFRFKAGTGQPTGWTNALGLKAQMLNSTPLKFDATGNPIGEDNNGKITIEWRWRYESGYDHVDTSVGSDNSDDVNEGIGLDLTYSATQTN